MNTGQPNLFEWLPSERSAADLLVAANIAVKGKNEAIAVEYLVSAVRTAPNDNDVLRTAAARFMEVGRHDLAAQCYDRVASRTVLETHQISRHASALLASHQPLAAADMFLQAQAREPGAYDHSLSASVAFMEAGDPQRAVRLLLRIRPRPVDDPGYVYQLAAALGKGGHTDAAIRFARALVQKEPSDWKFRNLLASILNDCGHISEAIDTLRSNDRPPPPQTNYLRSVLAQQQADLEAALGFVEAALTQEPDNSTYRTHRGGILSSLHRFDDAAEEYLLALKGMPDDVFLRRAAFATLTESGRYRDAVPVGAALVAQFPADSALADTLQIVLDRQGKRQTAKQGQATRSHNINRFGVAPIVNRAALRHKPISPLAMQARAVMALILRETRTRFGRSRFGYAWVIFEPLAHIGIMITLISLISHSRIPPVGESFALFYFTGIIPYHLFTHTVSHLMRSVPENRPLLQLPRVKVFDVYLSRALLELITEISVAFILLCGFVLLGLNIIPLNAAGVVIALLLLWLTAFGIGLLSAVISAYFSGWERVWGAIASILYFTSGTFYIPRMMPEWLRDVLVWSPILQGIEFVRVNYFHQPYPHWLDIPYICACAFGSFALGLIAERIYRRKLLEIE